MVLCVLPVLLSTVYFAVIFSGSCPEKVPKPP